MLRSFRKFFDDFLLPTTIDVAEDREHRLRLATAALLMEMTRAISPSGRPSMIMP